MSARRAKLLAANQGYMARVKAAGGRVESQQLPCCEKHVDIAVPPEGEFWDSLMCCPHCDATLFKVVTSIGCQVTVVEPGAATINQELRQ